MYKRFAIFLTILIICIITILPVDAGNIDFEPKPGKSVKESINVDQWVRNHIIHLPEGYDECNEYPLVLCFHGRGGRSGQFEMKTGFSDIADREGFIVVYPEGINKAWYLKSMTGDQPDDLIYIEKLIEHLDSRYSIDKTGIFACGHSNGGFLSIWLAVKQSSTFTAVGSVAGGMVEFSKSAFDPSNPVSVLLMHGTSDSTVPFKGGTIKLRSKDVKGLSFRIMDTQELVDMWVEHNGCNPAAEIIHLPNDSGTDGTTVSKMIYSGGKNDTGVILYTIKGGRHGWPTKNLNMSSIIPGTCRDIEAAEEIWAFFKDHLRE